MQVPESAHAGFALAYRIGGRCRRRGGELTFLSLPAPERCGQPRGVRRFGARHRAVLGQVRRAEPLHSPGSQKAPPVAVHGPTTLQLVWAADTAPARNPHTSGAPKRAACAEAYIFTAKLPRTQL